MRVGHERIPCPDADLFGLVGICGGFQERQELFCNCLYFVHVISINIYHLAAAAKELLCCGDVLCKALKLFVCISYFTQFRDVAET